PRTVIAMLAAVAALGAAAPPALAAKLRVEGPAHTVFQGRAKPLVGTLQGHTTRKSTALGALVRAARRKPFQLGPSWYDGTGDGRQRLGLGERGRHARRRIRHGQGPLLARRLQGAGNGAGRDPLADPVGARLVAALTLAVAAAGCGQGAAATPAGPAAVTVTVTRDYGATRLASGREAPGQSALNALRRLAHVGTSYGGRFVESIGGLSGDRSAGYDWLYFVNGIA